MHKEKMIRATAPATIGNVSCGFDVFGLAVEQPGDEVVLEANGTPDVVVKSIEGDGGVLSLKADENTASVAVMAFLKAQGIQCGVDITLKKNLPLGSGMGSSAASAVAAVVAINHMVGSPLTREQLLPFAMEAELVACGAAHADNAAPCLVGGLVLVRQYDPLDIIQIPTPDALTCVLVHPNIEVKTRDARLVLKKNISLKDGITQWANTAALVAGMMKPDYDLIGRSLVDVIAEPVRSILIPQFDVIKKAAMDNGALGCGISGSGPSLFGLCKGLETARKVGAAMQQQFTASGIDSEVYCSKINTQGAIIHS